MSKRLLVLVVLVGALTVVAGGARASEPSATTPKLCDLIAPTGTGGAGKVTVDEGYVLQMYTSLEQASDYPLPKSVKKAVKTLLPLYEKLATGKGQKAMSKLGDFVEKECGASAAENGGKDAGDVNPCDILKLEDAQTLAGTPVNPGSVAGAETATRSCTYTAPVTGPTAQVEFYIGPGAKKSLDVDRKLKHEITPVSGLGDEGYVEIGNIFWQQDGTWYWIRVVRLDAAAQDTAPLETAARDISTRL